MPRLRACVALLVLPLLAAAEDWPQWLGPRRDGTSAEVVKPWKGDLKVLWRERVGPGHSSPVVAGGKVYLHTKVKDKEAEQVAAYDAKTGKELWTSGRLGSGIGAGPVTYMVGGKQYVAVVIGRTAGIPPFVAAKV